mmetsp:Transcript_60095/g.156010  ORF Transcript_60095/g.156010 Transcript_60095/m.156010 type:complete len:230 (-) Transcript_60095:9-698(-)
MKLVIRRWAGSWYMLQQHAFTMKPYAHSIPKATHAANRSDHFVRTRQTYPTKHQTKTFSIIAKARLKPPARRSSPPISTSSADWFPAAVWKSCHRWNLRPLMCSLNVSRLTTTCSSLVPIGRCTNDSFLNAPRPNNSLLLGDGGKDECIAWPFSTELGATWAAPARARKEIVNRGTRSAAHMRSHRVTNSWVCEGAETWRRGGGRGCRRELLLPEQRVRRTLLHWSGDD